MSLIKVVPYVVGVTPGVPGAPEPRMYPRMYFLVSYNKEVPGINSENVFTFKSVKDKIQHIKEIVTFRLNEDISRIAAETWVFKSAPEF